MQRDRNGGVGRAVGVAVAAATAVIACKADPATTPPPPTGSAAGSAAIRAAVDAAPTAAPPRAGPPAPPPIVSCAGRKGPVGVLYAGDPLYNGDDQPSPAGVGFRADPPLRWRDVVISHDVVFTHVGQEIWAGTPTGTMRRIVGEHQPGAAKFRAGPCATARLAYTDGIAALPDGSLVVADVNANALVRITHPADASCEVRYYAGTATELDAVSGTNPPNLGKDDGTGAAARFQLPFKPVAGPDGTVYVLDQGNRSIRKVERAGDVGTVTTIAFDLPAVDQWNDLALRGDKLVVVGQSAGGLDSYVVLVDPATGAHRVLVQGGGAAFPPADPDRPAIISAVAADGDRIFVSGSGRIWQVDDTGRVTHLAGGFSQNELNDFPRRGYDPAAEHAALDLELKHSLGDSRSAQFLTFEAGALYWSARAYSEYVIQVTCL